MSDEWLSLSETAELLGVHPGTVRLWSDKGLLPTHKTQGGHRRYRRSDIELWSQSSRGTLEPENMMNEIIKNVRVQIAEGRIEKESWYQKLDQEARDQYRMSARSLFHGLMNYVVSTTEEGANEAYAIGYEYASRARRYQLNYVDAVKAFLFFRRVLIESVAKVYSEANIPSQQATDVYSRIQIFTDDILISLLETYEKLEAISR